MAKASLLLAACLSLTTLLPRAAFSAPAGGDVWVLDIEKLSGAERIAAAAIQGLANRSGPHVYLQPGQSNVFMSFDAKAMPADLLGRYRSVADFWLDYYGKSHGFHFQTVSSLGDLLARAHPYVKGAIVYSEPYPGDLEVATTLAGLKDSVPVTAGLRDQYPGLRALPVLFDTGVQHTAAATETFHYSAHLAEDFAAPNNPWQGDHLAMAADDGAGKITLDAKSEPPWWPIHMRLRPGFFPLAGKVRITVRRAEAQWGLKLQRPGAGDVCFQADTAKTGTFEYDLGQAGGWQGEEEVDLTLWVIGAGRSVWVDSLEVELTGSKQSPKVALYDWAVAKLLPQCSKDGAYSYTEGLDAFSLDIAVARRMFVYSLSHAAPDVVFGDIKARLEKQKGGLDPPGRKHLDAVLAHLNPVSPIWGWGGPSEETFLFRVSQGRAFVMCAQVPNLSFHAQVQPLHPGLQQRHLAASDVKVEPKAYVAFMTNEGDTAKCAASLINGGGWLQPERGSLPISWGVSAYLCEQFPGMMEYVYSTATPNDCFFSFGGYGYAAPAFLPADMRMAFAERARCGNAAADTRVTDIWYYYPLQPDAVRHRWLAAMDLIGLTQWHSDQRVTYPDGCPPIIHSNHYYNHGTPEAFAQRLQRELEGVAGPWFTVVYGGDPHWFAAVAHLLPAERFKVVRLDEMFLAARKARAQVEGKVVKAVQP